MNRIVRDRYPVARLPEDLREQIDAETVRLVIDVDRPAPSSLLEIVEAARSERAARLSSEKGDAVERIRVLREEWTRRDEWHERIRAGEG